MEKIILIIIILKISSFNTIVECRGGLLIPKLAKSIVEYFNLKRFESIKEDDNLDCGSIKTLEDYFFQVYSLKNSLKVEDLNQIIHFSNNRRKSFNKMDYKQLKCAKTFVSITFSNKISKILFQFTSVQKILLIFLISQ